MTSTVVKGETVFVMGVVTGVVVVGVVVVVVVVEVDSVPSSVVVVCIGVVRSVGETSLSAVNKVLAWVVFMVIGVSASVVVLSKGYAVVKKSGTDCSFVNLYKTYTNTPMARRVPRPTRTERSLDTMLFGFA